jgi:hypothetical protein
MSRPVGITVSAIVAGLGSIVTLLFAVLSIASLFLVTPQPQPPNAPQLVIAAAAMCVAFAVIGMWTAVGLFRLRSWARTSILIFAGFVVVGCLFCLLLTMAVPLPPEFSASTRRTARLTMALMFAIPLVIGVWWLIQFNAPSTKAAFASPIAGAASPRPMSITVIALMTLVGAASCILGILTRTPAFLFGSTLNGWSAGVVWAIFGALSLFIGKGLLDLREEARILAIGWFGFSLAHTSLVMLVPPWRKGLLQIQQGLDQNPQHPIPFDLGILTTVMFASGAIVSALAIWFLVRHHAAFGRTEES